MNQSDLCVAYVCEVGPWFYRPQRCSALTCPVTRLSRYILALAYWYTGQGPWSPRSPDVSLKPLYVASPSVHVSHYQPVLYCAPLTRRDWVGLLRRADESTGKGLKG